MKINNNDNNNNKILYKLDTTSFPFPRIVNKS